MIRSSSKTPWYKQVWIPLVVVIVILSFLLFRKRTEAMNLQEYIKQNSEQLMAEMRVKDSLYNDLYLQKEKVRVVREKTSTYAEEQKIKKLEEEILILRNKETKIDSLSPIELGLYFKRIIK